MNSSPDSYHLFVRPIEPRDAADVSSLIHELGYQRTPQSVLDWIAARDSATQTAFVACVADQIVGWIEVCLERRLQSAPRALIGGLVVKEGFRGKGIGRMLCERAEAWSWQHPSVEKVRVTSRSTRDGAHRFYLRDGYQAVKTSLVFEKPRPA